MIRYFNLSTLDHFYTANYSERGCGGKGYGLEEIGFEAFSSQQSGSVPLYRYWNQTKGFHFYTTNFSELGNGGQGYVLEGTARAMFTLLNTPARCLSIVTEGRRVNIFTRLIPVK